MRRTAILVTALGSLALPFAASAQEPYSPLVPRGKIRLDARGTYSSFSDLLGVAPRSGSGAAGLGDAFSGTVGTRLFPFLGAPEAVVNSIVDEPYSLSLGTISAFMEKSVASVPLAIDVGVFDWLTVGAFAPLIGNQTELTLHFTSDSAFANAGFSPALENVVLVTAFLNELGSSIGAYDSYREATCQADPSSPGCTGATDVLRSARALENSLTLLYEEAFAPVQGSPAGEALQAKLADLVEAFAAAGLAGPSAVPLATARLTLEDIQNLVTDPLYGIGASHGLGGWRSTWQLGDVEVRADARLIDTGDLDVPSRIAAGAGATVRLPTGSRDDPANFLDSGFGDGQWDVELRGWMNGRWRRGFGLWADLRYGLQAGGTIERRVFDPGVTFAPASSRASLDWNPGDYQRLEVSPWMHISTGLTALVGYRYFRKGEDSFSVRAGDDDAAVPTASPDPAILVPGTGLSTSHVVLGMVYNRSAAGNNGAAGEPLEIRVVFSQAVGGSGGAVPRETSLEVGFRLFRGIWGG